MDAAIERNSEALKRILAGLLVMAGLVSGAALTSPLCGGRRSSGRRVGVITGSHPPPDASRRPPHKGEVKLPATLPRHLWLAILRLLRPAEAAARRLIIAAARGLVVPPPAPPRKPKPMTSEPLLRSLGIAVVMSPADLMRAAAAARRAAAPARPRSLSLPLFDPLRRPFGFHRHYVPAHAAPRISVPGFSVPSSLPPPPSPDDPVSAARLGQRLAALASALDDLPGQARRLARWKAARDAAGAQSKNRDAGHAPGRFRRISPLRPGGPPGGRLSRFDPSAVRPRNVREIDEILAHAHALAVYALERPDTS